MPVANNSRWKVLHRFGPPMLITLGVLWLLQGVLAHTGNHGVIIRNLDYDAGRVKGGAVVTDTVRLTNLSFAPVDVSVQPSCGCTVADVPEQPVPALHGSAIKLTVDTTGMTKGAQVKKVLLRMQGERHTWEQIATIRFSLR